jgi:uracil-DNA glycosylase family 4
MGPKELAQLTSSFPAELKERPRGPAEALCTTWRAKWPSKFPQKLPLKISEHPKCANCPMSGLFPDNNFVAPLLVPGKILLVGEAPGREEDEQGIPFVGASGSWLRGREIEPGKRSGGLLAAAGLRDSECSRVNTMQCRPLENVYPTDAGARSYISAADAEVATKQCFEQHLKPVLLDRSWERIVPLGDKALHAVCDVPSGAGNGIMRWRGSPLPVPVIDAKRPLAVPTLHPSYLARSQELLPAVVNDLKKSFDVLPEYYNIKPFLEEVQAFIAKRFAFDIETLRSEDRITMVSLCAERFKAIVVPFEGVFIEELKRIFQNAEILISQNGLAFDVPHLEAAGITFPKALQHLDTLLMHRLGFPDLPHDLAFLGSFFSTKPAWKHLSGDDEALYCARDCDVTLQVAEQLEPMLKFERLWDLYNNVSLPLARICRLMTETGFRIDPSRIKKVRAELELKTAELELLLPEILRTRQVAVRKREKAPDGTLSLKTGKPVKYVMVDALEEETPWKSTQVLSQYLYEEKKLPIQTHAKTGQPSVDKTSLPKLLRRADAETQRAIRAIGQLRQIASLTSTFVKDEWNGIERVHSHFGSTASGRLSSSDVNLQNIPISARYIYVPSYNDWAIISSDFASLENRITALLAHDEERLGRLATKGFSEHKHNASVLFDIPYDEVVKDSAGDSPYTKAKKVTHGLNYGEGPLKIAKINDLPFAEVKALVEKWKAANPKTIAWQAETAARAKKDGFLTTPFSRKRWFYSSSAHTESLSFLPQSSAADILIRCMIALMYERIGWPESEVQKLVQVYRPLPRPARLLVTVHDSFVLESPLDMVDEVKSILERVLTQPWPQFGGYSFAIETGVGQSW